MKTFAVFIILCFLVSIAMGQERLTDIQTIGTNTSTYVFDANGKDYLAEVFKNGRVDIHKIMEDGSFDFGWTVWMTIDYELSGLSFENGWINGYMDGDYYLQNIFTGQSETYDLFDANTNHYINTKFGEDRLMINVNRTGSKEKKLYIVSLVDFSIRELVVPDFIQWDYVEDHLLLINNTTCTIVDVRSMQVVRTFDIGGSGLLYDIISVNKGFYIYNEREVFYFDIELNDVVSNSVDLLLSAGIRVGWQKKDDLAKLTFHINNHSIEVFTYQNGTLVENVHIPIASINIGLEYFESDRSFIFREFSNLIVYDKRDSSVLKIGNLSSLSRPILAGDKLVFREGITLKSININTLEQSIYGLQLEENESAIINPLHSQKILITWPSSRKISSYDLEKNVTKNFSSKEPTTSGIDKLISKVGNYLIAATKSEIYHIVDDTPIKIYTKNEEAFTYNIKPDKIDPSIYYVIENHPIKTTIYTYNASDGLELVIDFQNKVNTHQIARYGDHFYIYDSSVGVYHIQKDGSSIFLIDERENLVFQKDALVFFQPEEINLYDEIGFSRKINPPTGTEFVYKEDAENLVIESDELYYIIKDKELTPLIFPDVDPSEYLYIINMNCFEDECLIHAGVDGVTKMYILTNGVAHITDIPIVPQYNNYMVGKDVIFAGSNKKTIAYLLKNYTIKDTFSINDLGINRVKHDGEFGHILYYAIASSTLHLIKYRLDSKEVIYRKEIQIPSFSLTSATVFRDNYIFQLGQKFLILKEDETQLSLPIKASLYHGFFYTEGDDLYFGGVEDYRGNQVYKMDFIDPSNINEVKFLENQLAVFPNPTYETISIAFSGEIEALQIYDQFGRLVLEQDKFTPGDFIDVGLFQAGIYELVVYSQGLRITSRFIKI